MNGTTKCSGQIQGVWLSDEHGLLTSAAFNRYCPLRSTCKVHQRFTDKKPEATYELQPPFIGSQCDHYDPRKQS